MASASRVPRPSQGRPNRLHRRPDLALHYEPPSSKTGQVCGRALPTPDGSILQARTCWLLPPLVLEAISFPYNLNAHQLPNNYHIEVGYVFRHAVPPHEYLRSSGFEPLGTGVRLCG